MNYVEMVRNARPAYEELSKCGNWDGMIIRLENGKPIVVAVLQKNWFQRFLFKCGVLKPPSVPEEINGIKIKIEIRGIARIS